MSSIDDRIVSMQFNNAQFQQGIDASNESLKDLNKNLKLENATDGIGEVEKAAKGFSLASMADAIENISSKFSFLGAVGFTIIQNLTNMAVDAGKKMVGALIDPIVQGGAKRALALQQAKFQFRGLGLDIEATMAVALAAVKGTAFGLDDAALAAGQFGASGITAGHGLEAALRGIAGVAAQTGSSYSDVARIFESVAGNGRLMGQDLLSLSSRGVNAAATLAKSMGITEAEVRDMVTKGKISFAQFSEAMNNAFGANAAKANETYSGALSNMHAALARIGADVASPYFLGMRDIFNALGPLFDKIHTAIQPLLDDFGEFLGFASGNAVDNITNIFGPRLVTSIGYVVTAIQTIGKALGGGFKKVFPDGFENQLVNIGKFLKTITLALIPNAEAAENLKSIFAGFFAILSIAGQVIGAILTPLGKLLGLATGGTGGFLEFAAGIGEWLVKLDLAIKKSEVFTLFFDTIAGVLAVPIAAIQFFFGVIFDGFAALSTLGGDGPSTFFDDIKDRFSGLAKLGDFFNSFWSGVVTVAQSVWKILGPIFKAIGDVISRAVNAIADAFSGLSFDQGIQILNSGLLAGLIFGLRGLFGSFQNILAGNGFNLKVKFDILFGALRTNLKALEINTNAKTLTQIAIAVALLAASAVALSLVDPVRLAVALGAMAAMIKGLLIAFEAFTSIKGPKGMFTLVLMAAALQLVASAVLTLALAVALLGALPMANIVQGTLAIAAVIYILTYALKQMAELGPSVLYGAAAIAIMAPALAVMAGAVALLGAIPIANLSQGILGLTFVLAILVLTLNELGENSKETIIAAVAIGLLAAALVPLVGVILAMGAIPFENLTQGILGFAAILGVLIGAITILNLLEGQLLLSALALFIIASAMITLVGVVALIGKMDMGQLIQGVIGLAAVLLVMTGIVLLLGLSAPIAAAGAAALLIMAFALAIVAPAIALLGTMSWDDIGRSLAVLAAGLVILAAGGILLIPASVGFLAFGIAVLAIGAGVSLAASGIALLATALVALVAVGAGGVLVFIGVLNIFVAELPKLGFAMGQAFVNMVLAIGAAAPQMIDAFVGIILAMLQAIDTVIPALINTATIFIVALVNALVVLIPLLYTAGLKIIKGVLNGIAGNVGGITTAAINIIVNFINALANNVGKVITAAGNLVLSFITGITTYVRNNTQRFVTAGSALFRAIVDGISAAIKAGGSLLRYAGSRIGDALLEGAKAALGINSPSKEFSDDVMPSVFEGIEDGNDKHIRRAENAGTAIGTAITSTAISAVKGAVAGISDAMDTNLDMSPTIRPVVDLSDFEAKATKMATLMPDPTLTVGTSTDVADTVALQEQANNAQLTLDSENAQSSTGQVTFIQNNNSPKYLSPTDIYRQTQNQLSTLKGELGVVDKSRSA